MTAHYVGPAIGRKEAPTKIESRRMPDAKKRIGSDGRVYGQTFKELHMKMYGKPPFLEGRNFHGTTE